jgi:hypothetical protein
MSPRKYYGVYHLSRIFEVDPRTIKAWIADGRLVAHAVPGTMRLRVADADMRDFARRHKIPIDVGPLPDRAQGHNHDFKDCKDNRESDKSMIP